MQQSKEENEQIVQIWVNKNRHTEEPVKLKFHTHFAKMYKKHLGHDISDIDAYLNLLTKYDAEERE